MYDIQYVRSAVEQVRALDAQRRAQVVDAVDEALRHTPDLQTRNRKLLRTNTLAPFELRVGDVRVFYDVSHDPDVVLVVAVGVKQGSQLRIGGEVVDL
ncbi:MAG: type II toxin-antitoxin system RelE/ParE family toxin [Armatimonadetes bacterium]|nr:type II toxin-antitoxin system RelE/ParE family toxin [Armatimonadota bacterium]